MDTTGTADITVMLAEITAVDEGCYTTGVADIEVMLADVTSENHDTVGTADIEVMLAEVHGESGGIADITVPLAEVTAVGLTGTIGWASISVPLADVEAEGSQDLAESFDTTGTADITVPLAGVSGLGLTGTVGTADIEVPLILLDAAGYQDTIGYADIEVMLAEVEAYVAEFLALVGLDGTTESVSGYALVLNLHNNALTEYDNYGFNSFAYFNGKYLGANSAGIFELTGSSDNGMKIRGRARTGLQDGGESLKKGIVDAFLGLSAEDVMNIKVITDGYNAYEGVPTNTRNDELATQRVKFGKGIKSRYLGIELTNRNGCDFNLESAELDVVPLTRKF